MTIIKGHDTIITEQKRKGEIEIGEVLMDKTFVKVDSDILRTYRFRKVPQMRKAKVLYDKGVNIFLQPYKREEEDQVNIPYYKITGEFEEAVDNYKKYCFNEIAGENIKFYIMEKI